MKHLLAHYMKRFFSDYLASQRGLSENTILAYRDAIKLLLCYIADTFSVSVEKLSVEHIKERQVLAFLDYLEQVRQCSPRTRNARLAAIRSLFMYIAREEPALLQQCRKICAIPLKKTTHIKKDHLGENEIQAVLDAVDLNSRTGGRDKAMLLLLYNTGARVSEIVTLKCHDLRLDQGGQVRLSGKGKKTRICPIWPETLAALQSYLSQRNISEQKDEAVFLNANGNPITRFGIRYIIKKYGLIAQKECPEIKTKKVSPHTIRHTTAMHLLRSGNDVIMVSYWLGHADVNTTHIYLEIDMEMKRKMIEKAGPPNTGKVKPWHKPDIIKWLNNLGKGNNYVN